METERKNENSTFSHTDIYEVLSGTYPKTSEKIRSSLLYKVGIVFGGKIGDSIGIKGNNTFTPKKRVIKYEEMHNFLGELFGDQEQRILDSENIYMQNLRKDAEQIQETANQVCSITKKSFSEVIGFLLENGNNQGKSEIKVSSPINEETPNLSETNLIEIRNYVAAGESEKSKKERRIEMALKFKISTRHIGSITSWTKKWEKKPENAIVNIASSSAESKSISKREILREYLDEFFEGNILPPKTSGITYKDMHDCFCKDTNTNIDYGEVPRIWQSLLIEQQGTLNHKEKNTERRLGISLVKSRHKLESGEFVIDKSCNVLLPNEIMEAIGSK